MTLLEQLIQQHPAPKNDSVQFGQNGVRMDVGADVHTRLKTNQSPAEIKRGAAVFTVEPHADDVSSVAEQIAVIKALEQEGRLYDNADARELASSLRRRMKGLPTALVAAQGTEVQLVGTGMKNKVGNVLIASSRASGGGSSTVYVEPTSRKFGEVVHALASAIASVGSWKITRGEKGRETRVYTGVDSEKERVTQNEIHALFHQAQDEAVLHLQPEIDAAARRPSVARGIADMLGAVREKARIRQKEIDATLRNATTVKETKSGRKYTKTTSILTDDTLSALEMMQKDQAAGFEPDAITVTKTRGWFGR